MNQTASRLAASANAELRERYPQVDSFQAFPHPFGCSQLGDDLSNTQRILAALVNHPHAAAVLVLGLGCENNRLIEQMNRVHPDKLERVRFFNTQEVDDEVESGLAALEELAVACQQPRCPVPLNQLVLGMKCGGSDGLSGITANPLLGKLADRHCAAGGTVLLTEVPEMFGAESVLEARCANEGIRSQLSGWFRSSKTIFEPTISPSVKTHRQETVMVASPRWKRNRWVVFRKAADGPGQADFGLRPSGDTGAGRAGFIAESGQ